MLKCIEDEILNENTLKLIEKLHKGKIVNVKRHVKLEKLECDAVAVLKLQKIKRTVGFELKIGDLAKVLEQSFVRKHFFDYMYAICKTDLPLYDVLNWLNNAGLLKRIFDEKIGLILTDSYLVISKAKYNHNKITLDNITRLKEGK